MGEIIRAVPRLLTHRREQWGARRELRTTARYSRSTVGELGSPGAAGRWSRAVTITGCDGSLSSHAHCPLLSIASFEASRLVAETMKAKHLNYPPRSTMDCTGIHCLARYNV